MSAHLREQWHDLVTKTAGYWQDQPDEKLYDEWYFQFGDHADIGKFDGMERRERERRYVPGLVGINERHQMWGEVWPIYRGPGTSSYLAHEGIAYYGYLHTILEMEEEMRRRGLVPPSRPKLLDPNGHEV